MVGPLGAVFHDLVIILSANLNHQPFWSWHYEGYFVGNIAAGTSWQPVHPEMMIDVPGASYKTGLATELVLKILPGMY